MATTSDVLDERLQVGFLRHASNHLSLNFGHSQLRVDKQAAFATNQLITPVVSRNASLTRIGISMPLCSTLLLFNSNCSSSRRRWFGTMISRQKSSCSGDLSSPECCGFAWLSPHDSSFSIMARPLWPNISRRECEVLNKRIHRSGTSSRGRAR